MRVHDLHPRPSEQSSGVQPVPPYVWRSVSGRPSFNVRRTVIGKRFIRDSGPVRKIRMNHEIRLSPIMLIDQNNKQVGEIDTRTAQRMADEAGLDLVEIQPNVRPPLCKIMDYGKFKYEQSKKDKGNRAAGRGAEMKEVRLGRSIKIDPHDVEIRVNQARKFLLEGHKVQLVQQFRGREMAHRHLGEDRLKAICETLSDVAKVETPPRTLGRRMSLILSPDRAKIDLYKRKHGIVDKPVAPKQTEGERAGAPAEAEQAASVQAQNVGGSGDERD